MTNTMELLAAARIFVDEAGTPIFRTSDLDLEPNEAYVACAVLVPRLVEEAVLDLIPRDPSSGEMIKSSHHSLDDYNCASFIKRLLTLEIDIALVGLDAKHPQNVEIADRIMNVANAARANVHQQFMSKSTGMYMMATKDAIVGVWGQHWRRKAKELTFFEVVFDQGNISKLESGKVSKALTNAFAKENIKVGNITRKSRSDEPALLVPDLIAGAVRRWSMYRDNPQCWRLLQDAIDAGRILYQSGMEITVTG